uniref:H15 domain-containing protein n=1 Tax=Angiostrongylus cantonensis TaxID=6313 RepID=A0A0K0DRI8_ANGCA
MSDVAAAPATMTTSPAMKKATKPKGEKKARTCPTHPVYGAVIKSAIKELQDRKGASKQAILKVLTQASGTGAAGRFRLAGKSSHEVTTKVPRKPKVKSKTKPKERAAASPNKQVKKEKSSSSPKKAAKPKAKSAKSPQKVAMKRAAAQPKAISYRE